MKKMDKNFRMKKAPVDFFLSCIETFTADQIFYEDPVLLFRYVWALITYSIYKNCSG